MSLITVEVPNDKKKKKPNVTAILRKGEKEDWEARDWSTPHWSMGR